MGLFSRKKVTRTESEPQTPSLDTGQLFTRDALNFIPSRDSYIASPSASLTIPAIYRSTSIIATSAQQLALKTFKNGVEVPSPLLVRQPNLDIPTHAFVEFTVTSLALHGNAFWKIDRNSAGTAVNATVIHPDEVGIDNTDGRIRYVYKGKQYADGDFKHLALMRVPGELRGIGPIQQSRYEVEAMLRLRDYQAGWFDTGTVPVGILKSDQYLNKDLAAEYKDRFTEAMQGPDKTAVLGSGINYQSMHLNPRDAMYLETSNFTIEQIARMFGLPSRYLLLALQGSTTTYLNAQQEDLYFVKFTLMNYLIEIEQALSSLIPRGSEVKFDLEAVLRSDIDTRYQAYSVALTTGFLTADEVRAKEGLAPLTPEQEQQIQNLRPQIGGIVNNKKPSANDGAGKTNGVKGT